jgi:hypothetical protein
MAEAADPAFPKVTSYGADDLHVRSTEAVSGSDPDAAAIIKVDTLTGAASGLGRPMSSTAAAATAPLATDDFGWLLRGMVERRVGDSVGGADRRQGSRRPCDCFVGENLSGCDLHGEAERSATATAGAEGPQWWRGDLPGEDGDEVRARRPGGRMAPTGRPDTTLSANDRWVARLNFPTRK